MIYHPLGRSGLEVSAISLGTGGPSRIGQRTHADEAESHRVIQRALDLGINLLDTATAKQSSAEHLRVWIAIAITWPLNFLRILMKAEN